MSFFQQKKLIDTIEIVLTENKTSAVKASVSSNIQTILFLYFLDRVLINLSNRARDFLISEFDDYVSGIKEDFTSNPLKRLESEFGAYYFGTDFSLKEETEGKKLFTARGELIKLGGKFLMKTEFTPLFIRNEKVELYAIETLHAFFHFLIRKVTPKTRFILGGLLDHLIMFYEKNGFSLSNVGKAPTLAIASIFILEQRQKSEWFKEINQLLH